MKCKDIAPADFLFEISWEVCNKIGGIYTVLSTKAQCLKQKYKDNLIFIGPDTLAGKNESSYFCETETPLSEWARSVSLQHGISIRVGRWRIAASPIVVLVDYKSLYHIKNDLYGEMWNRYKVDSLHAYGDYDESCMFAVASAMVIEDFIKYNPSINASSVTAHFDEWTVGMGLLYTQWKMPEIATVFTTHATSIGRSICCNGKQLYDYLPGYNGDQMAGELNMQSKHSLEKAAAHFADMFTTVSDVTARECRQLLDINNVAVTPNGFDNSIVPTGRDYTVARRMARLKLQSVVYGVTKTQVEDEAIYVAISGRNEFRNKGIDLFIDSIKRVADAELPKKARTIVAFILVPSWSNGAISSDNNILTHQLVNPGDDAIYQKLMQLGLDNTQCNIKVVYAPVYLTGNDGVFDTDYYELLAGFDITVFPSYYEPWGYTPLESIAFGVPTITTNLSGFGQWVLSNFDNSLKSCGVKVMNRNDSNYNEIVDDVASTITQFAMTPAFNRRSARVAARKTAGNATWESFIQFYYDVYKQAKVEAINRNQ